MQVKLIPGSQFSNQLQVNALRTKRMLNQEKIEHLRNKMAKIKCELQDYVVANNEATRQIADLEAQIDAAINHAKGED